MVNKKIASIFTFSIIIFVCIIPVSLSAQGQKARNVKYDIKISITDTVERFNLRPVTNESNDIYNNLFFKEYRLTYKRLDTNIVLKAVDDSLNLFRTPISQERKIDDDYDKAIVNLGFLNFRKSFISDRIILSNDKKYPGSYSSMVSLLEEYVLLNVNESNVILFAIPFQNKKDIDLVFPGIKHKSKIFFILWILPDSNAELPKIFEDLDFSATIIKKDESIDTKSKKTTNHDISNSSKSKNESAISTTVLASDNKSETTNESTGKKSSNKLITYSVTFKVIGPDQFNLDNIPKPESLKLSFPESEFSAEGKYSYYPGRDKYNKNPQFSSMWTLRDPTDFIFHLSDKKTNKIYIYRANHEKKYLIKFKGLIPKEITISYKIESILYTPKVIKKDIEIKGKDLVDQIVEKPLVVPNKFLPSESITFKFQKPFNYDISESSSESDWRQPFIEVPIDQDTINLDFEEIPPFQFFYIDLSSFKNLQKIKDLLRDKIEEQNNDYFIYVSNSRRPLIWEKGDDLDELLTRVSLMRPEPASYYDEKRFIKPYIDGMVDDERIYSIDRREVHFNFLFSESFLNHSSQDFIQNCLGTLNDDDLFKKGKVKVYSFSTTEKPAYIRTKHSMDKDKVTYINLNNY